MERNANVPDSIDQRQSVVAVGNFCIEKGFHESYAIVVPSRSMPSWEKV